MEELFEFEVHKKDFLITDQYIPQLIGSYLEPNSLLWGGGYDSSKINGVISSTERTSIDINTVIIDFIDHFEEKDQIVIRVFDRWFDEIEANSLVDYKNLDLKKLAEMN